MKTVAIVAGLLVAMSVASFADEAINPQAAPPGVGAVSGGGSFPSGSPVTLTAAATNDCWYFVKWTIGARTVSTNQMYSFTATRNETVVARFARYSYHIQTASQPAGAGIIVGGGVKPCGTTVRLSAHARPGFRFVAWLDGGDQVGSNAIYSFTASSNTAFAAQFDDIQAPTLVVSSPAHSSTTSDTVNVTGRAKDNVGVAGVYYNVSASGWTLAQSSNNWATWSAPVPLAYGSNVIQFYAVDTASNPSHIRTIVVTRKFAPNISTFVVANGDRQPELHFGFNGSNYLVVYQLHPSGHSADYAQFLSLNGDQLGAPFDMNPGGSGDPPTIGYDGVNYLAAWADHSDQQNGVPIRGVFIGPDGSVGSVGQLTQSTTVDSFSTIAFGAGNYFLMWSDTRDQSHNGGNDDVFGAIFTPDGTPVATDFEIAADGAQSTSSQSAAAAFDGTNFIAVWSGSTGSKSVYARLIDPSGTFVTDPILVAGSGVFPCVIFDGEKYLVLFNVLSGNVSHVRGRFVSTAGQVLPNVITLSADPGNQIGCGVAFDGSHYLITWNRGFSVSALTPSASVLGRFFNSEGVATSDEFTIFPPQGHQIPFLAPALYDGTEFVAITGIGREISPPHNLRFTNTVITGAFISPEP